MTTLLTFDEVEQIISPAHEMAAYEALWLDDGATFKRIADKFRASNGALPSDLIPLAKIKGAMDLSTTVRYDRISAV